MQALGGEDDSSSRELGRFAKSVAENAATDMTIWLIKRRDRYLMEAIKFRFRHRDTLPPDSRSQMRTSTTKS